MIGFEIGHDEAPRLDRSRAGHRQNLNVGAEAVAARLIARGDHGAHLLVGQDRVACHRRVGSDAKRHAERLVILAGSSLPPASSLRRKFSSSGSPKSASGPSRSACRGSREPRAAPARRPALSPATTRDVVAHPPRIAGIAVAPDKVGLVADDRLSNGHRPSGLDLTGIVAARELRATSQRLQVLKRSLRLRPRDRRRPQTFLTMARPTVRAQHRPRAAIAVRR